ncbi:hypothetical protein RMT25_06390 [Oenococcus oeni]|uniref:hypothetical protein n=1 Tax=Oenococcus oeni TaxID=1247 RepID=UPI00293427FF|nr:hypothetical protein [Oenococcus oeni]WOC53498.1 hypothetical protein RMT25_06390 [Oenococcus oeni]
MLSLKTIKVIQENKGWWNWDIFWQAIGAITTAFAVGLSLFFGFRKPKMHLKLAVDKYFYLIEKSSDNFSKGLLKFIFINQSQFDIEVERISIIPILKKRNIYPRKFVGSIKKEQLAIQMTKIFCYQEFNDIEVHFDKATFVNFHIKPYMTAKIYFKEQKVSEMFANSVLIDDRIYKGKQLQNYFYNYRSQDCNDNQNDLYTVTFFAKAVLVNGRSVKSNKFTIFVKNEMKRIA